MYLRQAWRKSLSIVMLMIVSLSFHQTCYGQEPITTVEQAKKNIIGHWRLFKIIMHQEHHDENIITENIIETDYRDKTAFFFDGKGAYHAINRSESPYPIPGSYQISKTKNQLAITLIRDDEKDIPQDTRDTLPLSFKSQILVIGSDQHIYNTYFDYYYERIID